MRPLRRGWQVGQPGGPPPSWQVVLGDRASVPGGCYVVNPKLSITRVGTRAYHPALADLAPQVRLDLAQAEDARK